MAPSEQRRRLRKVEEGGAGAWQGYTRSYSVDEDIARTNTHYDLPAEFFATLTGGEWNTYSCNLWEGAASETESQERKLDLLAQLMDLQPGQRVLDVGCGWGGPLVYLSKRYGVNGVGITLSPAQRAYAERRAAEHDVEVVEFRQCHWRDMEETEPFDVVYTDEAICHFKDLLAYFEKVKALLKPGGRTLNKELHLASSKYLQPTRVGLFLTGLIAGTGEYRMLHDELAILDRAGFAVEWLQQIPVSNFEKTMGHWVANVQRSRAKLEALVGTDEYRRFRTYLRFARRRFIDSFVTIDIVVARPVNDAAAKTEELEGRFHPGGAI